MNAFSVLTLGYMDTMMDTKMLLKIGSELHLGNGWQGLSLNTSKPQFSLSTSGD